MKDSILSLFNAMGGRDISTLALESSYSPETFSYSVARTLEGWRSDFDEVFAALPVELGSEPMKVLAVLPANSPAPLMTVTVSAWLRRASLRIKPSRGDIDFARAWIDFAARHLQGLDATILDEVDLVAHDDALDYDRVIVFGSDETIALFQDAFKKQQAHFIGFGHRYSVAYVEWGHSATMQRGNSNAGDVAMLQSDPEAVRAAAAAARDIVAWDQTGCLSPQTIFVSVLPNRQACVRQGCVDETSAVVFARLLADELGRLQRAFPRRAIPAATSLAIHTLRMEVSMRYGGTVFGSTSGTSWTVLCDHGPAPWTGTLPDCPATQGAGLARLERAHHPLLEPTPLERTVWVKPVSGWEEMRSILETDIGHLEACGVWSPSQRFDEIKQSIEWGPHRIVRLGTMQSPSLGRFHGGHPPLCMAL